MRCLICLVCLCFSLVGFCQSANPKAKKMVFRTVDSSYAMDPVTGSAVAEDLAEEIYSYDGHKIFETRVLSVSPGYVSGKASRKKLVEVIFNAVKPGLQKLDDGKYILDIRQPVVDTKGRLVNYVYRGIKQITSTPESTTSANGIKMTRVKQTTNDLLASSSAKKEINQQTAKTLAHFPKLAPGRIRDKLVYATGSLFSTSTYIVVKSHSAELVADFFAL